MPEENNQIPEDVKKVESVEEVVDYTWSAASRPFKRKDRQFYITALAMLSIIALVFLISEGIMPVLMLFSLAFLYYVLHTVEPSLIQYKITNLGIYISDDIINWKEIKTYWFAKHLDDSVLVLETSRVYGRMELVVPAAELEVIKSALSKHKKEGKPKITQMDKVVGFINSKLPQTF